MASTSDSNRTDAWLRARVDDALSLSDRRHTPAFLGFLNEAEQTIARQALLYTDESRYAFFGGYEAAERCVLGCFPDYLIAEKDAFPIVRLTFLYRSDKALTHRDVLGTLLSQGIKRETIGDILCSEDTVVVFLRDEIADYIREQIKKIGGVGVRLQEDYDGPLPAAHTYVSQQDTIASRRLDVVIKSLVRCSRDKAAQLIHSECVSVNHVVCTDTSAAVAEASVISVRGYGRYMVDQIGPPTKKGRLNFIARKCI